MISSIFAAIAPLPVAARTITVDGNSASYAGEWLAGDQWQTDPQGDIAGGTIFGYDLEALWGHYDEANDTMYFRLDVWGTPADLDGNGNTGTVCDIPPGDCAGVGQYEQYTIILSDNTEDSGLPGAVLEYKNNAVAHIDGSAQWGSNCVEFKLLHASNYIDPIDFCIVVAAGGMVDLPGEDVMRYCLSEVEVSLLTPFGIITLVGILSILGLWRVRRKQ